MGKRAAIPSNRKRSDKLLSANAALAHSSKKYQKRDTPCSKGIRKVFPQEVTFKLGLERS